MTPLERATQALQGITIFWDETYDGAFVVTGDSTRYATNAEAEKAQAEAQVRAVIAAIREPSQAMKESPRDPLWGKSWGDTNLSDEESELAWKCMIDALLGEKPCPIAAS